MPEGQFDNPPPPEPAEFSEAEKETFRSTVVDLVRHPTAESIPSLGLKYFEDRYKKGDADIFLTIPEPGAEPDPADVISVAIRRPLDTNEKGTTIYLEQVFTLRPELDNEFDYSTRTLEYDSRERRFLPPPRRKGELMDSEGNLTEESVKAGLSNALEKSQANPNKKFRREYTEMMSTLKSLQPTDAIVKLRV